MPVQQITLNDGVTIPQLGFGVFQVDPATTQEVVENALAAGYRHLDTARIYGNEEGVGRALAASGLPRDEVFVTTKLWNSDQGRDTTRPALEASLERLGLDAVDLYLIHWPTPQRDLFLETWEVFEQVKADGLTRSIGVSNFRPEDLAKLADAGLATPSINQIELHPYLTQREMRSVHADAGIVTEAWSPLAQGELLDDPALGTIAAKHEATVAQVVLAWHLAIGNVVIPKSVTPSRIAANLASAGLTLDADDVAAIEELDQGKRVGPDPSVLN